MKPMKDAMDEQTKVIPIGTMDRERKIPAGMTKRRRHTAAYAWGNLISQAAVHF
jgi:hypothetical protein